MKGIVTMNNRNDYERIILPVNLALIELAKQDASNQHIFGVVIRYKDHIFSVSLPNPQSIKTSWLISMDFSIEPLRASKNHSRKTFLKELRCYDHKRRLLELDRPDFLKLLFLLGSTLCANDYANKIGGDGSDKSKVIDVLKIVCNTDPVILIENTHKLIFDKPLPYDFMVEEFTLGNQ